MRNLFARDVRLAAAGLFFCCSLLANAEDLQETDNFRAGRWDGAAYMSEAGEFGHCSAISSQPRSTMLLVSVTDDRELYVGVMRAAWKLPEGRTYTVRVSIDGRALASFEADVVGTNLIRFGPFTGGNLERLQAGTLMRVVAAREVLELSLADSRQAVRALHRCYAQHADSGAQLAQSGLENPFESSSEDDTGSAERLLGVVGKMLEVAGFTGTEWVDGKEVGYDDAIFGWRSAPVEGAMYYSADGTDYSDLASDLRKHQAELCSSNYLATSPTESTAGAHRIKSYEIMCGSDSDMYGVAVVEVAGGAESIVMVNDAKGRANVEALVDGNGLLREMFVVLLEPDS